MYIHRVFRTSLLALGTVAAAMTNLHAGVAPAPQTANRLISKNTTDTFSPMLFEGGRQAVVTVEAKTYTPFTISVYNPDGTLLISRVVLSRTKTTIWFDPPASGYYTISVTNPSPFYYGEYELRTN